MRRQLYRHIKIKMNDLSARHASMHRSATPQIYTETTVFAANRGRKLFRRQHAKYLFAMPLDAMCHIIERIRLAGRAAMAMLSMAGTSF